MNRADRALAYPFALLGFAAVLVIFATLYAITDPAAVQFFDTATNQTTNSTAQTAIDRRETIWNGLPIYVLLLATVTLVAKGVLRGRAR